MMKFLKKYWLLVVAVASLFVLEGTRAELALTAERFWNTIGRVGRLGLGIILLWPVALLAATLLFVGAIHLDGWMLTFLGYTPLFGQQYEARVFVGSFLALLSVSGLIFIAISRINPLVVALIALSAYGRLLLRWISTIVGMEIALAVYVSLIPMENAWWLIPTITLCFMGYIFLSFGAGEKKWVARTRIGLGVIIIAITVQFIYDWKGRVYEWATQSKAAAQIPAVFQRNGHVDENGYYHPPQKTTQEMPAKVGNSVNCNDEKTECHVIMNCNADLLVMDNIEPGEVVEVEHVVHHLERENRCTYSYTGDWYPMWGVLGMIYDPNLGTFPIPEYYGMAPHAIYFEMRDNVNNAPLTAGVITRLGGKSYPSNTSPSTATIRTGYNYPKAIRFDPKYNVQFGVGKSFVEYMFRKKPKEFIPPFEERRS